MGRMALKINWGRNVSLGSILPSSGFFSHYITCKDHQPKKKIASNKLTIVEEWRSPQLKVTK